MSHVRRECFQLNSYAGVQDYQNKKNNNNQSRHCGFLQVSTMRTATRPTKWTLRRRLRPSRWLLAASKYLMLLHCVKRAVSNTFRLLEQPLFWRNTNYMCACAGACACVHVCKCTKCFWESKREVQRWWHICMRQSWKQEVVVLSSSLRNDKP